MNQNKSYKEISFGQGRGHLILDSQLIAHINNSIIQRARVNLQTGNKFFKNFELSDLSTLKQIPHKVTFNLKGKPVNGYLYLFRFLGRPYCVYLKDKEETDMNESRRREKSYDYVMVKHRFNEVLFKGTLFQGNFLQINQYQNIFLIHDLLIWKDHAHLDSLSEKIKILTEVFRSQYTSDPGLDTHQIILKEYCDYNQLKDFVSTYRNSLPYRNLINGITFRPEIRNQKLIYLVLNRPGVIPGLEELEKDNGSKTFSEVESSLDTTIMSKEIKGTKETKVPRVLKPIIDHKKHSRVVFRMKKTQKPDVYELYLSDIDNKYGVAAIPTLTLSEEVRKWFSENKNEINVEAKYLDTFKRWCPVKPIDRQADSFKAIGLLVN